MKFSVLGTGCANCRNTVAIIEQTAKRLGVVVTIDKVEDVRDILRYDVMATPAVVVDGVVIHSGGVPSPQRVEAWLQSLAPGATSCCGGGRAKCCS